jgi:hypothetical protein
MLTSVYNRQSGKYILLKESIGRWCETAKMGNSIVIATLKGNYKLKFCGEFKPKIAKYKVNSLR